MDSISDKVKKLLAEHGQHENYDNWQALMPTSTLFGDLVFDDLDLVEVTMALEDEFDLEITDEESATFVTIADVVKYVEESMQDSVLRST